MSAQVILASLQQFGADATPPKAGPHTQKADDAGRGAFGVARGDAGVGPTEAALAFLGDEQAGRVELRLAEDEALQRRAAGQTHRAAAREGLVPDLGQARRIGVAKRAIE